MAVRKLFWEDPYLVKTTARVTSVDGSVVTLDRTVAYAFSGGQASDSGTVNGHEILKAEKSGKEILYTLPGEHGLNAGDEVAVEIDWEKRYRLMKLHFAAELVLELVYQNYDNPGKTGANITEDKARIDFEWKGNISDIFPVIEPMAREIIEADRHVISAFSDEENEKRYWEIEGFARVPCGGTHIKRTGEIGSISLKRKNPGGGRERIEITLC